MRQIRLIWADRPTHAEQELAHKEIVLLMYLARLRIATGDDTL